MRGMQIGLLLLLAIMPFHAFLSVWMGSLTGYQAVWQSWKELVALLLTGAAILYILKRPKVLKRLQHPMFYVLGGYTAISLLVTMATQPAFVAALYGVKTNLEFLVLFVISYLIGSQRLRTMALKIVIATGGVVIGFSLLQLFVLPPDFLRLFGYNQETILPYQLVDPAVEAIRISSTLGGPLQLGSFLLIPLSIMFAKLLQQPRWWQVIYLIAGLVALWGSHTRSAWLGLAVAVAIIGILRLPKPWRLPSLLAVVTTGALVLQLLITNASFGNLQYYLFHGSLQDTGIVTSTDQHAQAVERGVQLIQEQPLGYGLGSAGPASYQTAQPLIPESYYLQLGIEIGLIGAGLFIVFIALVGLQLLQIGKRDWLAYGMLGSLGGISVFNFFLHGWTDSSTAMVFWILTGILIGSYASQKQLKGQQAS